MPRNCGCSGRCDCVIKAGSGAAVTGSGRPEDPYLVSLAGGGGGGDGFDTGDVKWTARASAPVGWLVADGAAVSRTTYADLFDAIGTLYGDGDGTSTFNLPDYTGRFMLGADGSHPLGSSGGAEQRTLAASQMPAHEHSIDHDHGDATLPVKSIASTTAGAEAIRVTDVGNTTGALGTSRNATVNIPSYSGASGSAGGGQPFSIMPPYGTGLPLIKT